MVSDFLLMVGAVTFVDEDQIIFVKHKFVVIHIIVYPKESKVRPHAVLVDRRGYSSTMQ